MAFDFNNLIIFEMANNHQGSLEHGLRIIDVLAELAHKHRLKAAVKLQYRDLDTFIHSDYKQREDVKHIPRFLSTRLTPEEFQSLVIAIKEKGMLAIVTPFDEKSVELCRNHGVDILKVASCSCMDWPLLEEVASTGDPVICSTGGCRLADIDKIVTFFEHRVDPSDLALLHCIGKYPTDDSDQQLHMLRRMMDRYPHCAVGYSGHESPGNLGVARAVVAMGAEILERHVGLPTDEITLNQYSLNPEQTEAWIEEVLSARAMCGAYGEDKHVSKEEEASLLSLARGVWAKEKIFQGDKITKDKVYFAMPVQPNQTTSKEYLETLVASRDYDPDSAVEERRTIDKVRLMRDVLHEGKGLLREAKINIGKEYEIELSHHYGLESFRRVGAIIISFVNRSYCKKLILLLPGQDHPSHAHIIKEETFQILYGDLNLVIDGEHRKMRPGDMQLVRRGQYHAFSTRTGCIFEEISTTHNKGDSLYEDSSISQLDPVQRKTVIDEW